MRLLRIEAPHFVAGVVFYAEDARVDDRVTHPVVCREAAPIVRYMLGWELDQVERYASKKDWRIAWADE